jgi:Fe-S-cluster containining protein
MRPDPADLALHAPAWLMAARRADVIAELGGVYAMVANQIAARGPACWASGRCCNFKASGHLLYTTGLEAAATIAGLATLGRGAPSRAEVEAAEARGDCPFLIMNACSVHTIKPMGCRVYFCDQGATTWQEQLSERALRAIREIHERHGIEYRYTEWRALLGALSQA